MFFLYFQNKGILIFSKTDCWPLVCTTSSVPKRFVHRTSFLCPKKICTKLLTRETTRYYVLNTIDTYHYYYFYFIKRLLDHKLHVSWTKKDHPRTSNTLKQNMWAYSILFVEVIGRIKNCIFISRRSLFGILKMPSKNHLWMTVEIGYKINFLKIKIIISSYVR